MFIFPGPSGRSGGEGEVGFHEGRKIMPDFPCNINNGVGGGEAGLLGGDLSVQVPSNLLCPCLDAIFLVDVFSLSRCVLWLLFRLKGDVHIVRDARTSRYIRLSCWSVYHVY